MPKTIAAAAALILLESGPLLPEDLHGLLVRDGVTRTSSAAALRTRLDDPERFVVHPDGRYDCPARILAGTVLTTRPRRRTPGAVLWTGRDLEPFSPLLHAGQLRLADGGLLRPGTSQHPTWIGPVGWLPDLAAGELLALRWDGRVLDVRPAVDVAPADSGRAQEVRRVLAAHTGPFRSPPYGGQVAARLARAVPQALLEVPDLLSEAVPPLDELLPLPEELRPQDIWGVLEEPQDAVLQRVRLPSQVHAELGRRADLVGEALPVFAGMLLTAAADRALQPAPDLEPTWPDTEWRPGDYAGERYDDGSYDDGSYDSEPYGGEFCGGAVLRGRWGP